jgi:hypothetical protein
MFSFICFLLFFVGAMTHSASAETGAFYKSLTKSEQRFSQFYKKPLFINGKSGQFSPNTANTLVNGKLYMEYKKYPQLTSACSGTVIPRPRSYRNKRINPVLIATAAHA